MLRREYFSPYNIPAYERFFLVEIDKDNYYRAELKELLYVISRKWSKITERTTNPFCAYVYIHGIDDTELVNLKLDLFGEDFIFIDGYPFKGSAFITTSIIKQANYRNATAMKIIDRTYNISLILEQLRNTKEIYQFYFQKPYFEYESPSIRHIKMQINNIKNIKEII